MLVNVLKADGFSGGRKYFQVSCCFSMEAHCCNQKKKLCSLVTHDASTDPPADL